MAEPQKKTGTHGATVSSCAATDCAHNESSSCTASAVEMKVANGKAVCGTYSPDRPKARA